MTNLTAGGTYRRLDQIMLSTADLRQSHSTLLICFFTGIGVPQYCVPMRREPAPTVGQEVGWGLSQQIDAAMHLNPAVHDGAVIAGRFNASEPYVIRGWSYRLFPPGGGNGGEANRGSAFNSGMAMSEVLGVDAMYLVSGRTVTRFTNGGFLVLD